MCPWYCLIALGMISYNNLQLLCELLEEIGRKDLSERVKNYVHKKNSELLVVGVVVLGFEIG